MFPLLSEKSNIFLKFLCLQANAILRNYLWTQNRFTYRCQTVQQAPPPPDLQHDYTLQKINLTTSISLLQPQTIRILFLPGYTS